MSNTATCIDLSEKGQVYYDGSALKINGRAEVGDQVSFLIGINLTELLDIGGVSGLNDYVDEVCHGFVLEGLDYEAVRVATDDSHGDIVIRVGGTVCDY
jgi:hypothetical protein